MTLLLGKPRLHGVVAAIAAAALLAGCGSSDDGADSTAASTTSAGTTTTAAASSDVPYDGPEARLANAYAEPRVEEGLTFRLGWLEPAASNQFVHTVVESGVAEAERLGADVTVLDAGLNVDRQVTQCNQLVAQRVDAMVVYAVDPAALTPCLRAATAAGIPIVGQDTPPVAGEPLMPGYLSAVLQGVDRGRYLQMQDVAAQTPSVEFATLGTALPVPLLRYSVDQAREWGERFGLRFAGNVDAQDANPETAATATNTILSRHPDVRAIIAFNDPAAQTAATTVRAAGRTDVRVYGFSGESAAVEMVEAGQLAGTVLLNAPEVGIQMARGAYNALTRQNLPLPEQIVPEPTLVTGDNAGSVEALGG
ncbi:sugar ABC transporter substrate-binding protein [Conexibacter stalactiti]|uniref:Sugar ABC transporter substrate-binding protein n=1 Tax=Conexibacter stalactiti TaxID=1940611 RepID=A0ABU4HJC9_9ACTN|nr:sugar ABC transporter substrate-binding protein [Conexibacter stalactiti]MDW5593425.1 sugar ABC transporter substrate-binding protein [Conexibacter stalactiti]MEC5034066.1 sugar ABC transporter substrate-binding protein [Conexibacter stalactiti]